MRFEAHIVPQADRLSAAFEHSITWEDDLWRADPVDVEAIHAPARRKFSELLDAVTKERGSAVQARILLFHGQSGAGKTHLIRALRTSAHRAGKAYVGYAQMTPDVANYADYYLRRLVNSLEKPYDPDQGGESGLARLTNHLVGDKAALDPNTGEGRAFEIIESLGRLMWTVDRAALVFCIDQVEDLRFFSDPQERFQRAARDLIQVANRVPTSIVLVSCLGDFYGTVREGLAQSYVDRIEKAGPVRLEEARTAQEARLIIAKRLAHDDGNGPLGDPSLYFGPEFYEEFAGLSTRRILELAQARVRQQEGGEEPAAAPQEKSGFISTLAAAL